MKGRKLDEVTDAVMTLLDREIAKGNIPFGSDGRGKSLDREVFRQVLADTIERATSNSK